MLDARTAQREAMKDAVEMAVLSHIRHPGIVSVYSCFTDMVEDGARAGAAAAAAAAAGGFAFC